VPIGANQLRAACRRILKYESRQANTNTQVTIDNNLRNAIWRVDKVGMEEK
jgi:ribosomal protein L31E